MIGDNLRKFDVGGTVGIEYAFENGFFVDLRYRAGFINALKKQLDLTSIGPDAEADGRLERCSRIPPWMRYTVFHVGVGYRF